MSSINRSIFFLLRLLLLPFSISEYLRHFSSHILCTPSPNNSVSSQPHLSPHLFKQSFVWCSSIVLIHDFVLLGHSHLIFKSTTFSSTSCQLVSAIFLMQYNHKRSYLLFCTLSCSLSPTHSCHRSHRWPFFTLFIHRVSLSFASLLRYPLLWRLDPKYLKFFTIAVSSPFSLTLPLTSTHLHICILFTACWLLFPIPSVHNTTSQALPQIISW